MLLRNVLVLGLILFCGCKEKLENCSEVKTKVEIQVDFYNYKPSDIDTIFIGWYTPDNKFVTLLLTDTIITPYPYEDSLHILYRENQTPFFTIRTVKMHWSPFHLSISDTVSTLSTAKIVS
jgi:hypothetical protein